HFIRRYTSFRSPTFTTRTRRTSPEFGRWHDSSFPVPHERDRGLLHFHLLQPMRTRILFQTENCPGSLAFGCEGQAYEYPFRQRELFQRGMPGLSPLVPA